MSKKSKSTTTTNESMQRTQTLDPSIRNAVFGADGNGGYVGSLVNTFQNNPIQAYSGPTYAGLNPTQQGALGGTLDYLKSPMATAGYDAMTSLGRQLQQYNPAQLNLPGISAQNVSASPITAASIDPSTYGSKVTAPRMQAATVAASQGDPLGRFLSGNPDNPQLRQMMKDTADVSTENFFRQVAPQLRGGAIAAGGYGGSRQGIMEGLAAGDLNNSIQRSNTGLLGSLYESAQNRALNAAGQLSGQDLATRQANAGYQQQANAANAGFDLQSKLANLENEMGNARFNASLAQQAALSNQDATLRAGLANQGAGLSAAGLTQQGLLSAFGLNSDAQQRAVQNQLTGAGLLQDASQIPLQNFQTALNVGNAYQQDQQGQYQDAYRRFQEQQMAPWQTQQLYGSLLSPFAQLGSGVQGTSNSTTVQKSSSSDPLGTALGIAGMVAAPFTGGASLGLGQMASGAMGSLANIAPSIFGAPAMNLARQFGGYGDAMSYGAGMPSFSGIPSGLTSIGINPYTLNPGVRL